MQEKNSTLKLILLFNLIFIPMLLIAKTPTTTSIKKIIVNSSKTDAPICARMKHYSYGGNHLDAKSYVKITPNHPFTAAWSYNEMCLTKLQPHTKYQVTFYKNMPLGEMKLDKSYSFTATTLDYKSSFSFPEEGYILPTKGDISIPVDTINTYALLVSLYRINNRNLIKKVNKYGFLRSLSSYKLDDIEKEEGYLLWKKRLKIDQDTLNKSKTTAIPVGDFLKERKPGVYILSAIMLDKEGEEIYDYNDHTQWFMVSDIGLYTLKSKKGLEVLTKKLSTAKAYSNVKLELIAKNNEILDSTVSKNGHAFFPSSVLRGKNGLEVKAIYAYGNNNEFSVLDFSKPAHDLSDRGVEGRENPGHYDAFMYSNRGIFRPGESITLHTILRDKLGVAKARMHLSLKLFDSREVNIFTKQFSTDSLGHFDYTVDIAESASTGKWRFALFAGSKKEIAQHSFLVEDFVPPKIKVLVKNTLSQLKPKENAELQIAAKYLNGEALPHAKVEVNTIIHKAKRSFKKYSAYHFGDIQEKFRNKTLKVQSFETDEKGELSIPFKIEKSYSSTLPLAAHIDIAVSELGGRPVHKIIRQFFTNKNSYIGLKPHFLNHAVNMDASVKFDLIYLQNQLLSSTQLHYELIKEETHWHWRSTDDSWEYYKTYSDGEKMSEDTIDTLSSKPVTLALKKLDWGSYRLIIKDQNNTLSSYRFTSGYEQSSSKSSPDRLPLSLDKQSYKVADTLRVNIQPKFTGPIVVYIAHDDLIESKTIDAVSGQKSELTFKVSKTWGSSAYVLATAFRAQSKKLGANRAVGLAPIKIEHPEQELHLSLSHIEKTASDKTVKVRVVSKEAAKTKTNFTLAAVDEGILNLTAYKVPNPAEYFLGQRKLGIEIRDIYANLIQARGAHAKFNVGSDSELVETIRDDVVANKRKVVALFTDVLSFNKEGIAEVELEIPDYQGALKLMALAWNTKATGSTQSELIVKDSISMEYYMPLFISVGDKIETLLTINFDTSVAPGHYRITLTPEGGIALAKKTFDLKIDAGKSFKFSKKLTMRASTKIDGAVNIEIRKEGKTLKRKQWEIAVRSTYPETYVRKMGMLKQNETFNASTIVDEALWISVDNITLKISGKPLFALESLKEELIDYRWRCAEQTTSRAMPWLFLKQKSKAEDEIITNAIERLLTYQHINGSFGLWTDSKVNMWLSAYVLDFLSRAKKAGYVVPKNNIVVGLNWIENNLNRWDDNGRGQEADVYGLYVLARNGRTLMSELKYHATSKSSKIKSAQAWGHLGAAFAYVGEKNLAKKMFKKAKKSLGYSYSHRYYSNYGGSLRDEASLIALMYESQIAKGWENLVGDLALNIKNRRYLSTQEINSVLRVSFLLNDMKKVGLKLLSNNALLPLQEGEYKTKVDAFSELPEIQNISAANNWYNLSFKATPLASQYNMQNNNGFSIVKTIHTMEGKPVNLSNITQNKRLVIVIKGMIENTAIKHPLLTDWIISGFELENPNLTGIDATSTLDWIGTQSKVAHSQYRNDRFAAALTLNKDGNNSFNIAYVVRAVSVGSFALPPSKIEDMYQPRYRALSPFLQTKVQIKNNNIKTLATLATTANKDSNNNIVNLLSEKDYLDVYDRPLKDLSKYKIVQLNFLRNSIFAHAGLSFEKTNPMLHQRFLPYSWYKPSTDKSAQIYKQLSTLHQNNVQILLNEEKRRGGGLSLADFYRVNSRILTKESLLKYDKAGLRILRNSLFARYGLAFKKSAPELDLIYSYMPWYKPKEITVSEIFDTQMNKMEKSNILLMLTLEKARKSHVTQ